ncbi:hypothetical protein TNCT_489401, partial [Trichonephila clavata]
WNNYKGATEVKIEIWEAENGKKSLKVDGKNLQNGRILAANLLPDESN